MNTTEKMKNETALFISESEPEKVLFQHYCPHDLGIFTTKYEIPTLNPVAKFNLKPKAGESKVPQISCFITNGEKTKMPF